MKLLVVFFALLLMACSNQEPIPTPTATPAPTATGIPTATPRPTSTPQTVEALPEGCVGWLKGLSNIVYLCSERLQTTLVMGEQQCAEVETEEAVIVHFISSDGPEGQVVKMPHEKICASNSATFKVWAEFASTNE